MRLFFLTFFFTCSFFAATAQQAKQYAFTHLTTANGLPSNLVNSIVQDEEGYLWFGTTNGLSRYDGYRFLNFKTPRNSAFVFGNIALLYYDKAHNIWVVTTDNKIGIFNPRDFTFKEIEASTLVRPAFQGISLLETPDGNMLLQVFLGESFRWDKKRNMIVPDSTTIPRPSNWKLSRMVWDPFEKKYWMSADSGIAVYNPAKKLLSYRGHNAEANPVIERFKDEKVVLYLTIDQEGNIDFHNWPPYMSHPLLCNYNRKTGVSYKFDMGLKLGLGYHELGGCLQQRDGRMWVYGNPILAEWSPDRTSFTPVVNDYRTEQSIRFDYVRTAFEDGERNVWAATDNGLFFFNPDAQLFNNYNFSLPGDKTIYEFTATSIFQAQDSTLYVGTWGGLGLFMYDKAMNQLAVPQSLKTLVKSNPSIWAIKQHSKTGNIWITLQGGELIIYNPKTKLAKKYAPNTFTGNTIRQLTEDGEGNLWFGMHSGAIVKWNYNQSHGDPNTGYTQVYKAGQIQKLITDSDGFIWAATFAWGVVKINPVTEKVAYVFTKGSPTGYDLLNDVVSDVIQYDDSTIIAVSNGLNFINRHTNKVRHITTAEGLPSNSGMCIQKDNQGVLWLGMQNNLCRINLQKNLFTLYDRRNGIAYDNFMAANAFRLLDGRIAMSTDHNFLVFEPQKFLTSTFIPPDPEITSFTLSDVPLSVDSLLTVGKTELPYDNTSVAIQFSILSFLKQKQPYYSYILEGFDKDWSAFKSTNVATYSYLPSGEYTFKVIAINQDGMAKGPPATLKISVRPPFWRTWWFYGLISLFAITVLYLIDKERQKKRRALQTVRTQIAADLHDEINVTLNDINLLSEIAKIKADKDIDRSKDYIDQISTKSRTMIESMDDILWSIHPENDSMERMLLRIFEFTDGLKKTANLDVDLSVDKEVKRLTLDMKMRHEFLLFYKDALVYVIQHSVCDTIYISLEYLKAKLTLKLLAQCNKLDDLSSQIQQLEYGMQRRADALNGMLDVMSDRKSISIILQVPV